MPGFHQLVQYAPWNLMCRRQSPIVRPLPYFQGSKQRCALFLVSRLIKEVYDTYGL